MAWPCARALPDPGGWRGAAACLLAGPAARGLAALDLDAGVFALAELHWIEQAGVGPASGILRRNGAYSLAWAHLHRAVMHRDHDRSQTGTGTALTSRVAVQIQRHGALLPAAMRQRLLTLHDQLAAEGVVLEHLAAAHAHGSGVFVSRVPAAVQGAPGWEIHIRIEPTLDGAWLVTARRTWAGVGPEPHAPAMVLTLRADEDRPNRQDDYQNNRQDDYQDNRQDSCQTERQISRRIEEAFALWYEDRPFAPLPRVSVRSDSGP